MTCRNYRSILKNSPPLGSVKVEEKKVEEKKTEEKKPEKKENKGVKKPEKKSEEDGWTTVEKKH